MTVQIFSEVKNTQISNFSAKNTPKLLNAYSSSIFILNVLLTCLSHLSKEIITLAKTAKLCGMMLQTVQCSMLMHGLRLVGSYKHCHRQGQCSCFLINFKYND